MENKILVVDINYIMPELKDMKKHEIQEHFERVYECKVILVDGFCVNMQGQAVNNPPIYFA